jgi:hypothetical protein
MPDDNFGSGNSTSSTAVAAGKAGAMRIFVFKSEASPRLRAFGGDLIGSRLPNQFSPWRAIGALAPDREAPYNLSRNVIETAINDCGYQLWRLKRKAEDLSQEDPAEDVRVEDNTPLP